MTWKAPQGILYLAPGGAWKAHPMEAGTFDTFDKAAAAAAHGEGVIVNLGYYQPWAGSGWTPGQLEPWADQCARLADYSRPD